jgi:hypothetical protein
MSQFQNVTSIGRKEATSSLEDNLKSFLDWSFLQIGGFINVDSSTTGLDSLNYNQLKVVSDPVATSSKMWQSPRKDWIYESGIAYSGSSPISISGISLNGTFLPTPTGSGSYTYSINYPLGIVTFDNNVSSASSLSLNYSYRYIQVYKANDSSWWKELQDYAYTPSNSKTNNNAIFTASHGIQMPLIMVENIARTVLTPYELGTTQNIITQDVLLHIFTETPTQRDTITDILLLQKDKTLSLYDVTKVVQNQVFPLNYKGQINPSGLNYSQLFNSSTYRSHWATIKNANVSEMNNFTNSLFNTIVRWSVEIFP